MVINKIQDINFVLRLMLLSEIKRGDKWIIKTMEKRNEQIHFQEIK